MNCPKCGRNMYHVHADVIFEGEHDDRTTVSQTFDNHIGWQCVKRQGGCGFQSTARVPTLADEGPLTLSVD